MNLYEDVAIIFKRTLDNKDLKMVLKSVKIVSGNFSPGVGFISKDNTLYMHAINEIPGNVFGLRIPISKLKEEYNIKLLAHAKRKYFKMVKDFNWQLIYDPENENIYWEGQYGQDNLIKLHDIDLEIQQTINESEEQFTNQEDNELKEEEKEKNIVDLASVIKDSVIAQDDAIDNLITVLWANSRLKKHEVKNNIIMIGNSGVGKTSIIRAIAKQLGKVVYKTSAATLTESGYVGNSVEDILKGLVLNCDGDIEKASNAIVVLDEFDKIAIGKGGQIATESVQNELLTLLEDGEFYLTYRNNPEKDVTISTKNITFICVGAFQDLKKIEDKKIGFGADINPSKEKTSITSEDLIKYGYIPEIIGRLPIIIELNKLTYNDLIKILKSPNGYLAKCIKVLESDGISIEVTDDAYIAMASIAQSQIGARALQSIVTNTFFRIWQNVAKCPNYYKSITITDKTVFNPNDFEYKIKAKTLNYHKEGQTND